MKEKTHWFVGSKENKDYPASTYYRCVGIGHFVEQVEKTHKIVGVTFEGNNIGLILDERA